MDFLSERNLCLHREYLESLYRRLSIFEKSYPTLKNKWLNEIKKCKIPYSEREAASKLKSEIIAHEIFFSSFGESGTVSQIVKKKYGSEASFLYMLYEKSVDADGFLFLFIDRNNEPNYFIGREYEAFLSREAPMLAIDLFEHAYFYDFGFDKKRYLQSALSALDLLKLNKQ